MLTNVIIANNTANWGAGLVVSQSSSLQCNACFINGNVAAQWGGGIAFGGGTTGTAVFTNSVIDSNIAEAQGGGLWSGPVSQAIFVNVTFSRNSAPIAAGMFAQGSNFTFISGSAFVNNAATSQGGGIACQASLLTFGPGTVVSSNVALGMGGAFYVDSQCYVVGAGASIIGNSASSGGGMALLAGGYVNLTSSIFSGNAAGTPGPATASGGNTCLGATGLGGGIYMMPPAAGSNSPPPVLALTASTVTSNTAASDGAGIAVMSGSAQLSACAVSGNAGGGDGGGLAIKTGGSAQLTAVNVTSNTANGNGGGIVLGTAASPASTGLLLTVNGCTISGNVAGNATAGFGLGGGIYLGAPSFWLRNAAMTNNSAFVGGGLAVFADWAASQAACAIAASTAPPMQGLVFSSNTALAGLSLFWLRSASATAAVTCTNCTLPWPLRPSELATEPIGVGFSTPPAASIHTGVPMPSWTAQLLDFYGGAASTYGGVCTLLAGAPLQGVVSASPFANASAQSTVMTLENYQMPAVSGLAAFNATLHGIVGLSYNLSVSCTSTTGIGSSGSKITTLSFTITVAPCAPGTQVSANGRTCDSCKANTEFNLQAGGTCRPCPLGASCPSPNVLSALPDWWRSTNSSVVLFNCPLAGACLPGTQVGIQACLTGYAGPACALCAPGYYPWGHACRRCDKNFNWLMPFVGTIAAIAFVAMFALPVRPDNVDPVVRAKIVMTFLQVLGLIKDFAIDWRPRFLLGSLSYFDVLNIGLELSAPACGGNKIDFYSNYVITMMLPPAAVALCFTVWAVHRRLMMGPWRQARPHPTILLGRVVMPARGALTDDQMAVALARFTTRCLKNAAWLLLLLYPGVCKKVMQLYGTRTMDIGTYLRADYAVLTRDSTFVRVDKYQRYVSGGILMCLLYPAGIPLLFGAALWIQRRAARASNTDYLDSFIGFVAAGYTPKVRSKMRSLPRHCN